MTDQTLGYDILTTGGAHLADLAPLPGEGLTVTRMFDGDDFRVRVVSLAAGSTLAKHIAGAPVLIHVASGHVRFSIGGEDHELHGGALVRADAHEPHEVHALEPSRLILSLRAG